jgi:hypothetical protein
MNVRILLEEVNHPYCEASPDFCNWEHEFLLYHGLEALAPYTHSTVHAKYWDRGRRWMCSVVSGLANPIRRWIGPPQRRATRIWARRLRLARFERARFLVLCLLLSVLLLPVGK